MVVAFLSSFVITIRFLDEVEPGATAAASGGARAAAEIDSSSRGPTV
jgi:hypothetical protein